MALSFPLSPAEFQDVLELSEVGLFPDQPRDVNRTSGGAQVSASLGDTVWRGTFTTNRTNSRSVAARRDALISVLDRPGASFLMYDPAKEYPAADPDGAILGAATPQISSLDGGDARLLSLNGLPASYQLTAGDLIGWHYATGPVRYALHRVVSDVTAAGNGVTGMFEVTPFIQPGASVGTEVRLVRPLLKAVLLPAPEYGTHRPLVSSGMQFSFVQTVR